MKKITWYETTREEIDNNPNTFSNGPIDEWIEDDPLADSLETLKDWAIRAIYENSGIYIKQDENGDYKFTLTHIDDETGEEVEEERIICRVKIEDEEEDEDEE